MHEGHQAHALVCFYRDQGLPGLAELVEALSDPRAQEMGMIGGFYVRPGVPHLPYIGWFGAGDTTPGLLSRNRDRLDPWFGRPLRLTPLEHLDRFSYETIAPEEREGIQQFCSDVAQIVRAKVRGEMLDHKPIGDSIRTA